MIKRSTSKKNKLPLIFFANRYELFNVLVYENLRIRMHTTYVLVATRDN